MLTAVDVSVGRPVAKGDKLATLEAMKMQTNLLAPAAGVIAEIAAGVGDAVDAGDLILKIRPA
jgi:pyruvate carboxylase